MLLVDKSEKISKNNVQKHINQKLTGVGLYLFCNSLDNSNILINLKQTTKITNRNIRFFSLFLLWKGMYACEENR